MKLRVAITALILGTGLVSGQASAVAITASDIETGSAGGLTFTPAGGGLGMKTTNGVDGVGVTGGVGGNEIDVGQSITASSGSGFTLNSTTLAFLYDGPEYNDYQEVALLTGEFFGSGVTSEIRLENIYESETDHTLNLYVDGALDNSLILGASDANTSVAGTVDLGALFGDNLLSSLTYEALTATECGIGTCRNQSDFGIAGLDVSPVPEPGTLALLGLGLAGLGAARRYKR